MPSWKLPWSPAHVPGQLDPQQVQDNFKALEERANALSTSNVVSVLPASPVNGQRVTFQTAGMAAVGVRWELEYNASSGSAYKWEYVGGGPLYTSVGSGGGPASITSATWSNAPTTQCDVTLPLAGDYEIVGQTILNPAVSGLAIVGVAIGVGGSPPVTLQATNNVTGGGYWSGAINGLATALASGTVLRMRYWHQSTGNITVLGTNLMVRPIRVG